MSGRSLPDCVALDAGSRSARRDEGERDPSLALFCSSRPPADVGAREGRSRALSPAVVLPRARALALGLKMVQSDGSGSEPASGGTARRAASIPAANTGV